MDKQRRDSKSAAPICGRPHEPREDGSAGPRRCANVTVVPPQDSPRARRAAADDPGVSDGVPEATSAALHADEQPPLGEVPVPRDDNSEIAAYTRDLTKVYGSGDAEVVALDHVDVDFVKARFTAVMGPSGSGKSTLMHCVAGLDAPTSGEVVIGDTNIATLKDSRLTELRRDRIGFVFQSFNLIPTLTALENIELPMAIAGRKPDPEWLDHVIDIVGLRSRLKHKPSQLSGGQQQRVACARALVGKPDIIFADEPTGNLDSAASAEILGFLASSVTDLGQTIVMVTHDPTAAAYANRALFLADGRIVADMDDPDRDKVLARMVELSSPVDASAPGASTQAAGPSTVQG